MHTPRSLRSPRNANGNPGSPRSMISIQKIDVADAIPQRIRLPKSMKELLRIATDVLELRRPAKRICTMDGQTIASLKDIAPDSIVYISCVDETIDKIDDEDTYRSRMPKSPYSATRTLPSIKPPESKPRMENVSQHQAIAASGGTVKGNLRSSILGLYASLPPEAKSQLDCNASLAKATLDCQQFEFENSLLSQFISPTKSISQDPLGKEVCQFSLEQLKGLRVEECQFAIVGPVQSGKTTLLSVISSLFYQKLQLAGESNNYLFFPINWLIHQIYFSNISTIYELFVKMTIAGLGTARKDLIPILPDFQKWLLSLLTIPTQPPLPPIMLHFKDFPIDAIILYGKSVHSGYFTDNEQFLRAMVSMPSSIAHSFGMVDAIYIFDHFDCSSLTIVPDSKANSSAAVDFAPLLCEALQGSPYFIAAQGEREFYNAITLTGFKQLSTERLIQQALPQQNLIITKPQMTLKPAMTNGCPGYCAIYNRLVGMVEQEAIIKSQFARFRSVIDNTRQDVLRQELFRVCLMLAESDSDNNFQDDVLNDLMEQTEVNVRLH